MTTVPCWPTHFYVGQVKDHDKIVEAFMPYILNEKKYFHDTWTLARCKSSCHHPENDKMPWELWFEAVRPNFEEYFASLQPIAKYNFKVLDAWANIYHKDGYQEIHDHSSPHNHFSCSYFFEYPDDIDKGGELILENTNFDRVSSTGVDRIFQQWNQKCYIPKVQSGTIVIFPSWAKHFTNSNPSNKRRVTFSGNFSVTEEFDPSKTVGSIESYNHNYLGGQ